MDVKEKLAEAIHLGSCCSTVEVMEWIRDNNCPYLDTQIFTFDDGRSLYVSSYEKLGDYEWSRNALLNSKPLDQWWDVFGMKRLCVGAGFWYAMINDKLYWITD